MRHGHILFKLAKYKESLIYARQDLRMVEARWRFINGNEYKTKWEASDAMLMDDEIKSLNVNITKLEASITMYEALLAGYEDYRNAASREISRRQSEQGHD